MSKQGKSRMPLIVGIIAAVVILAALLVLLLTQCTGGETAATTAPSASEDTGVETYEIYWNMDRKEYDGKSEAGMSSRVAESDGFFHVRFFKDGEIVDLKVADRKTVNAIDIRDLMGLVFNDEGVVIGVIDMDEMPCEQVAWQFYVASAGGKLIKTNSSASLNGMEVLIETTDKTGVWDMTGLSGEVGCDATPMSGDRLLAVADLDGNVTHVFLYERSNYMRTHEAECEHCKKTVEWSEWTKTDSIPTTTGHYQLMNDITTGGQSSMVEDAKICLDLNGKRVDGKANARVYSLHNPSTELAIMDTSEKKDGRIAAHGKGDQGMCVWLRYGVVYLYDGILDASDATSIKNGCAVALQGNTYMYMHGGEIIGGTSTYLRQENGKYTNGLGGSVALGSKSKFVLNDGVIRDGFAEAIVTKYDANKQPSTYERGIGGNIFMSSGSLFEMNGGTIQNGKAGNYGGNVSLDGTAEFIMNNGTVSGGKITGKGRNGGNFFVSSKSILTINGGTIKNGSSRNCAGNIYLNGTVTMNGGQVFGGKIYNWSTGKLAATSASRNVFIVNGKFSMYGGHIDGGVQAIDTVKGKVDTSVLLSGYATINSKTAPNLSLSSSGDGIKVYVGNMYDSAKVGVTTTVGIFSLKTKESNVDSFYSDIQGADILYVDECLALGRLSCLCGEEKHLPGCDGKQLFWAPWTAKDSLPTTTGNYYLLNNVTCGQQNVAGDAVINLDLNGKKVDGKSGTRIYSMHYRVENTAEDGTVSYEYPAHLTVTDTSKGHKGVMASHGNNVYNGSLFWLRYGDVTLITGTYDASDCKLHSEWTAGKDGLFGTADDVVGAKHGVAVHIPYGRTFTMHGGTIIGGEAATVELTKYNTIPVPEDAPEGTEPTKEEVKKTVTGGRAGAVYIQGKMVLNGGTIRDGVSAHNGGNFCITSSGNLEMNGGTIQNGWSKNVSGNIHLDGGTLSMNGGTITGGKSGAAGSTSSENANVFSVNGKMNLTGGTITGHVRVANYNTDGATGGSVVRISGNPVIYGDTVNMVLAPQDDKTGEKDDGKTPTMPILRVVGPMTEGANIHVKAATGGIDFAVGEGYTVTEADGKAFTLQATDVKAAADADNNSLFFGRMRCYCGKQEHTFGCQELGGGKTLKWYAWNSDNSLPTTGNWYLIGEVNGSGSTTVKNETTLNLDLNGQTVNWEYRAYRIYDKDKVAAATLTLTNTVDTEGTIRSAEWKGVDQGCAVWIAGGEKGTFNLLDGVVLDGSKYTITNAPKTDGTTTEKNGGVVAANSSSVFNMYGGTIIGANTVKPEPITLADGTVYKSYAPNGGAVTVDGVMHMYGGTITGGSTENQGGNVLVNGDMFMYSGLICDGYSSGNAGNVFVHRNGELHMSGDARIEGGESAGHSGSINVDGKMTMTDNAVVTGGKATGSAGNINVNVITSGGKTYYGQLTMTGKASVTDGLSYASGGNVRVLKGATLHMSDDTVISGGIAQGTAIGKEPTGGNLYITDAGAKAILAGNAKILDGTSYHTAGNVRLSNGATLTVKDNATISGGKMSNAKSDPAVAATESHKAANIFCVDANLVLEGGSITGNTQIYTNGANGVAKLTLSGDPVVFAGGSGFGLYLSKGSKANNYPVVSIVGPMTGQPGSIEILPHIRGVFASGENYTLVDGDELPFAATQSGIALDLAVIREGNNLVLGGMSCLCGQETHTKACLELWNGEQRLWKAWNSTSELPKETGNYYLINNVTLTSYQEKVAGNANVVLDLNGKTVTGRDNCRMYSTFNEGGNLTITDKSEGAKGVIKGVASGATDQGILWARYGTINLVAGTIDGSGFTFNSTWDNSTKKEGKRDGGTISVSGGATFNMYGGTVIGANGAARSVYLKDKVTVSADTEGAVLTKLHDPNGGALAVGGIFNMFGGEIKGGNVAGSGGVGYISGAGKMTIHAGATVSGGTAAVDAGTFLVEGQLILDGGQITGGTATGVGGAIGISAGGNFTLKDGTVSGGNARDGGVIAVYGEMTMESGDVKGGVATGNGGAIVVASGAKFTLNDGTVSGGNANNGGNIQVSGEMIMNGGAVQEGTSNKNGGGIRVTGTFTLNDGTVSNNWGKNVTGNFHVDGGKLVINGGTIKDGKHGSAGLATAMSRNINSVNGKIEFNGGTVVNGVEINNYNVENANYPTTKFTGNAKVEGVINLTYSTGKAMPLLEIDPSFTGSLKVYVRNDGIITTGAVTEAQAAKVTTSNSGKDVYRITDQMGFPAEDVGKLYVGQLHCICGASKNGGSHYSDVCDGTIHTWMPHTGSTVPTASGYYYLNNNLTVTGGQTVGTTRNIVIDLNGYDIVSTTSRLYSTRYESDFAQKVAIVFTNTFAGERVKDGGRSQITVMRGGHQGRIVWLNGEDKSVTAYNLDIDLQRTSVSDPNNKNGLAFASSIENGKSNDKADGTTVWARNYINIYNVKMVGGTTHSNGQMLAIGGATTLTVKDSYLTGGNASHFDGTTETANGGVGGAIYASNNGLVVLHNTEITGCTATKEGGAVYMDGNSTLKISGNTKIHGNTVGGIENNVYVTANAKIETGTLGSDAQVGLAGLAGDVLSTDVTYAEKGAFKADSKELQVVRMADGLSLQPATAHIHCVCGGLAPEGHSCVDIVYTEAAFDAATTTIAGDHNWYLPADYKQTGQQWFSGKLNLCLNGHTLANKGTGRTLATSGSASKIVVSTCDPNYEEGSVTANVIRATSGAAGTTANGGVIWVNGGTVELYKATLDASGFVLKPEVTDTAGKQQIAGKHGAAVHQQSSSKFYMYGGTIIGGKTISITGTYKNGAKAGQVYREASHGGAIAINAGSEFYMYDGVIKNGTCSWGVRVDGVRRNSGWGGNVYLAGTFHMSGGLITDGAQAKEDGTKNDLWTGGNMTIRENGVLNINGGQITGKLRAEMPLSGNKPVINASGSAKLYNGDTYNNITVTNFDIRVGELNKDAKIGLLVLSENDITSAMITVASGITADPAQFPVHDLELTNSSTRTFAVEQDGTALKIVETTK